MQHIMRCSVVIPVGVARFIDASIYRDTIPVIRIAILFLTIAIFLFIFIFFFHNDFHLGRKDTIIISTCNFCKVIPQIHSYFVKIFCEISAETT